MSIDIFNKKRYLEHRCAIEFGNDVTELEYDLRIDKEDSVRKNIDNLLNKFSLKNESVKFDWQIHPFMFFPLYKLRESCAFEFLDSIYDAKNNDNFIGNKFVSNISKIKIENALFDDLIYEDETIKLRSSNRIIIRKSPHNYKIVLDNLFLSLSNSKDNYNNCSLYNLIDLVSDAILQSFNYWIITLPNLSDDSKNNLIGTACAFLESLDVEDYIADIDILNFVETQDAFKCFLAKRSEYGVYIEILQKLKEEENQLKTIKSNLLTEVPYEYKLSKSSDVPVKEQKRFILEVDSISKYEEKLIATKEIIRVFSMHGSRNCSENNILDLKVFFREIYLSKSKYTINAASIVRDFLNNKASGKSSEYFQKLPEYMFLREKVSRGYFRECSSLMLYNKKNKFQELLYKKMLEIILICDFEESNNILWLISKELIKMCYQGIEICIKENPHKFAD